MAHLHPAEVESRRLKISQDIIAEWSPKKGEDLYFLLCPCGLDCPCVPLEESPRLRVSFCPYPGELDFFVAKQPFEIPLGFVVTWFCSQCQKELACGTPFL